MQLTRRTSAPITQLEIGKGLQRETELEARSPSPHLGHCGVSLVCCVSERGGEVSVGGFEVSRPGFEASLSLTTCCLSFPGLFPQGESHEDNPTTATYLQGWQGSLGAGDGDKVHLEPVGLRQVQTTQ